MDYLNYSEKLKSIEFYIKSGQARNVKALAQRIEVSERTILRMVDTLKLQGHKISYSKKRKEYFFEE